MYNSPLKSGNQLPTPIVPSIGLVNITSIVNINMVSKHHYQALLKTSKTSGEEFCPQYSQSPNKIHNKFEMPIMVTKIESINMVQKWLGFLL
jgi:hypothetical protein